MINNSVKWSGLNGLDLAQTVTTKKKYIWQGFKTWKKEKLPKVDSTKVKKGVEGVD